MKQIRPAFTIIEVLVSVVILSGAILYTLQIHSQNHQQIVYLSEQNKHALQDSLFLLPNVQKYHKEERSAYDLLQDSFHISDLKNRELLKKTTRKFFIPEETILTPPEGTVSYKVLIDEIKLKGTHSSTYFHFIIQ